MLGQLTTLENMLIQKRTAEWISQALSKKDIEMAQLKKSVTWLYSKAGYEPPKNIEVYDSPNECVKRAQELGIDVHSMDSIGLSYDAGWIAFYEAVCGVMQIEPKHLPEVFRTDQHLYFQDFLSYREFLLCGVWDCICCDTLFICSRCPTKVYRDEQGSFHCLHGTGVSKLDCAIIKLKTREEFAKEIENDPQINTSVPKLEN